MKLIKGLFCSLMILTVLLTASNVTYAEEKTDMEMAQELVYGKWGPAGADWIKYRLNENNVQILEINEMDPYGRSSFRVNMKDQSGQWNDDKVIVTLVITYNTKTDKYEMYIGKTNPRRDRADTTDKDFQKKFIKVYWEENPNSRMNR